MKKIFLGFILIITSIILTGCSSNEAMPEFVFKKTGDDTAEIIQYNGVYEDLVLPNTYETYKVTSILTNTFSTLNIIKTLTVNDNLEAIGEFSFSYCQYLSEVSFSESSSLITLGSGTFNECTLLEKISLYNCKNLNTIGSRAFKNCTTLKDIYIPLSVTTIGANAFDGCSNVTIHYEGESIPEGWNEGFNPLNRKVVLNSTYQE